MPGKVVRKIRCEFQQGILQEPLLYNLGKNFDVVPNIRGATVTEEKGTMDLELQGDPSELERVLVYLRERGVSVEEILEGS